jgi:transposase InsO family protein
VKPILLPARSPNLNAYAERWVRSVKEERLARLILFGKRALRHALAEFEAPYHQERPHQGKGNVVLMPFFPKGYSGSLVKESPALRRRKVEEPGPFWGKDLSSAANGTVGSSSTTTATRHEHVPGKL